MHFSMISGFEYYLNPRYSLSSEHIFSTLTHSLDFQYTQMIRSYPFGIDIGTQTRNMLDAIFLKIIGWINRKKTLSSTFLVPWHILWIFITSKWLKASLLVQILGFNPKSVGCHLLKVTKRITRNKSHPSTFFCTTTHSLSFRDTQMIKTYWLKLTLIV